MPDGKYFVLVSKLSGCAIGPENGNTSPGVKVVTVGRNDNDDRLCYYIDPLTGTLRNKASGLCVTIGGDGKLVFHPYDSTNKSGSQRWWYSNFVVKNIDTGRVMDITGESNAANVPVCAWDYHGHNNQLWDRVNRPAQFFLLKGEASGRVLDIMGAKKDPGTKICLYDANKGPNQQWYEDSMGFVRSKLNDFVFDDADKSGDICMQPYEANNPHRAWVLNGAAITPLAKPENCLDVTKEKTGNGSTLCSYKNRNAPHQRWVIQYV